MLKYKSQLPSWIQPKCILKPGQRKAVPQPSPFLIWLWSGATFLASRGLFSKNVFENIFWSGCDDWSPGRCLKALRVVGFELKWPARSTQNGHFGLLPQVEPLSFNLRWDHGSRKWISLPSVKMAFLSKPILWLQILNPYMTFGTSKMTTGLFWVLRARGHLRSAILCRQGRCLFQRTRCLFWYRRMKDPSAR